jgi:hypothetical protein
VRHEIAAGAARPRNDTPRHCERSEAIPGVWHAIAAGAARPRNDGIRARHRRTWLRGGIAKACFGAQTIGTWRDPNAHSRASP